MKDEIRSVERRMQKVNSKQSPTSTSSGLCECS